MRVILVTAPFPIFPRPARRDDPDRVTAEPEDRRDDGSAVQATPLRPSGPAPIRSAALDIPDFRLGFAAAVMPR